ncbi:MAG: M13 family metallopeptidase [Pyrinomonadaceae bacterium]
MRNFSFRFTTALLVLFSLSAMTMAQSSGFDTTRMDTSANACNDFFQYANGTWLKKTDIPADRSRFGSFDILSDNNQAALHNILDTAVKDTGAAKGSNDQLIGDYYASCMDEAAIENAGTKPLDPYFNRINSIKNVNDLQATIAYLHKSGFPAVFGFGASPDIKNSTINIASVGQGGLSLPNRDYYTKDDAKSVETRAKFVEYMTNMFALKGEDAAKAKADADTVMAIQTRLALASKAPIELRNPEARYNKMPLAQAEELAPNLMLAKYISERGAPSVTEINIGQPDFFKEVNKMMTDVSIDQWKTYLRWMVLNSSANALPKKFVDESFNFFGKYMSGTQEQQPRWKRCIRSTDGAVGEALGAEYVKTAFTPAAQKRMSELIDNLFAAYREKINQANWMSPETRQKALVKLNAYQRKIGFNQNPRGYAGLTVSRKSYFDNGRAVSQFEINRNLKDIGQKVDRTRWGMTPPTVNAYYNPTNNEIVFPAGILQPPFFNDKADDAINYGAIGAVIGHEITHGFDDQGSKFDANGNYQSWWTPEDRAKFDERASCVADQFSGYEVAPGLNMHGKLTLGENLADLGGLTIAYAAYQKSLEGKPRPANIDGFTPEQRFFLGYAQVWAAKARAEAERQQVLTDPHALPRFRVDGPLSNLPQFAQAFGCKQGDAMVRAVACKIW